MMENVSLSSILIMDSCQKWARTTQVQRPMNVRQMLSAPENLINVLLENVFLQNQYQMILVNYHENVVTPLIVSSIRWIISMYVLMEAVWKLY